MSKNFIIRHKGRLDFLNFITNYCYYNFIFLTEVSVNARGQRYKIVFHKHTCLRMQLRIDDNFNFSLHSVLFFYKLLQSIWLCRNLRFHRFKFVIIKQT
jgi:hypothetical protein